MRKPSKFQIEEAVRVLREGLERGKQFSAKGDYPYASGCLQGVIENALLLLGVDAVDVYQQREAIERRARRSA